MAKKTNKKETINISDIIIATNKQEEAIDKKIKDSKKKDKPKKEESKKQELMKEDAKEKKDKMKDDKGKKDGKKKTEAVEVVAASTEANDEKNELVEKVVKCLTKENSFKKFQDAQNELEIEISMDLKKMSRKYSKFVFAAMFAGLNDKFNIDDYRKAIKKVSKENIIDVVNTVYELTGFFNSKSTVEGSVAYILERYKKAFNKIINSKDIDSGVERFFSIISKKVKKDTGKECIYNLED